MQSVNLGKLNKFIHILRLEKKNPFLYTSLTRSEGQLYYIQDKISGIAFDFHLSERGEHQSKEAE